MKTNRLYFFALVLMLVSNDAWAASRNILFKPVPIRQALEGYKQVSGALDESNDYERNRIFLEHDSYARSADLDLTQWLDRKIIHGGKYIGIQKGTEFRFYGMFANAAYIKNCKRGFALQRVKVTKEYFDANNKLTKTETTYLVEAFKILNNKIKGFDVHHGSYSLTQGSRKITKELEFGCGALPNYAQGYQWPFAKNTLYKNITQGYIQSPLLYNDVKFQFSKKYSYGVTLKDKNKYEFRLPNFITTFPLKN
ncbi:MAG: hypothetical protein AB8B83_07865 [Bdellovibrionales bacterium]